MDDFDAFVGTRPVAPQHAFDEARLAAWLRGRLEGFGGEMTVQQFKGGQSNPTFLLTSGERRWVLRRKPPGRLLPSAHAVEREYRVLQALAGSGVPVPRVWLLCEDTELIGTPFYLMDCVHGRVLWDPALPGMTPAQRSAHYDELNRVIAALHGLDPDTLGLTDYGRPGNYIQRQVARWTGQYRAAETEPIAAADALIDWLPRHAPPGDESRIVHGDYRFDNVIFHPEQPRIVAVLDWELSTLGHPLVDFAYHCMKWHITPSDGVRGLAGRDLATLGIPDEADYLKLYLSRCPRSDTTAIDPEQWTYCVVFGMFRLVAILQGVAARALQGNAASAQAAAAGRRARPLAELAWALARQLGG